MRDKNAPTHGAHEAVEDTSGEGSTTRKWLSHVQWNVRVVLVVLIKKLCVVVVR